MSYDQWATRVPDDIESVEDPPCEDCGAEADQPCRWGCACAYCERQAERRYAEREADLSYAEQQRDAWVLK